VFLTRAAAGLAKIMNACELNCQNEEERSQGQKQRWAPP
jgi:hypothetical protein